MEFAAPFILPWMPAEKLGYEATEPAIAFQAGPAGATLVVCRPPDSGTDSDDGEDDGTDEGSSKRAAAPNGAGPGACALLQPQSRQHWLRSVIPRWWIRL